MDARAFALMITSVLLPGCSILGGGSPLPVRLSDQEQAEFSEGWARFVSNLGSVDRTTILDTILLTQSWYKGVDRLYLIAERDVGDTRVITETQFERTRPELDTFTVRFIAKDGRLLREDVYGRDAIEAAIALAMTSDSTEPLPNEDTVQFLDRQLRLAERDARMARVGEFFQSRGNEQQADGPAEIRGMVTWPPQ